MACYHFTLKLDKRPDGTSITAKSHADYISREGKYEHIDATSSTSETAQNIVAAHAHAEYINREAAFAAKGGCVYKNHHLPSWANNSPRTFFAAADKHEDPKNVRYREIEFALPNELNLEQNKEIVKAFIDKHLGKDFYYAYAIHDKYAVMGNGEQNMHVHIMFSERKLDEIERKNERPPELFFAKANWRDWSKGGPKKDEKWNGSYRVRYLYEMRKDFATLQNEILEKYGINERVDHRSLKDQREAALARGDLFLAKLLDRLPEKHIGPEAAAKADNPKVIELQKYRELNTKHRQLLYAAATLEKIIDQDELNQSVEVTKQQADIAMSKMIFDTVSPEKEKLSSLQKAILGISKEIAIVKKTLISNEQAFSMARKSFLTLEELKKESNLKAIHDTISSLNFQKKSIERENERTMYAHSDKFNTEIKIICEQILKLKDREKEITLSLKDTNDRLQSSKTRVKILKKAKEIFESNRPAQEDLKKLKNLLDEKVAELDKMLLQQVKSQNFAVKSTIEINKNDESIKKILPSYFAEQARLLAHQQAFERKKDVFNKEPTPLFFQSTYKDWKNKKNMLRSEEESLSSQRENFERKFNASIAEAFSILEENKQLEKDYTRLKKEESTFTKEKKPSFFLHTEYQNWLEKSEKFAHERSLLDMQKKQLAQRLKSLNIIEEKANLRTYTAKDIKDIVDPLFRSMKFELKSIEKNMQDLKPRLISKARAHEMAKDIFTKGAFKSLRKRNRQLDKERDKLSAATDERQKALYKFSLMPKPKWYQDSSQYKAAQRELENMRLSIASRKLDLETKTLQIQKEFEVLEKLINSSNAKAQIEKITNGILYKNKGVAEQYKTLETKRISLTTEIKNLAKLKPGIDRQIKLDKDQNIQYSAKPISGTSASSSAQSRLPNPVKLIAKAMNQDSQAVALVAKLQDEEEVDFNALSELDKKLYLTRER